jgi:hypothetical protein
MKCPAQNVECPLPDALLALSDSVKGALTALCGYPQLLLYLSRPEAERQIGADLARSAATLLMAICQCPLRGATAAPRWARRY